MKTINPLQLFHENPIHHEMKLLDSATADAEHQLRKTIKDIKRRSADLDENSVIDLDLLRSEVEVARSLQTKVEELSAQYKRLAHIDNVLTDKVIINAGGGHSPKG